MFLRKKSILLLILTSFFCACKKNTLQSNWLQLDSGTTDVLWSAYFLNEQTGFVCGGQRYTQASILKTTDGGQTWSRQHPDFGKVVFDIQFVNDTLGYACAYDDKFLTTTDGGKSWNYQQLHTRAATWLPIRAIHFVNDTLGLGAGGAGYATGVFYRTKDGGKNWDFQFAEQELRDVFWTDPQTAYAVGYGVVYKTIDSGDNWFLLDVRGDFFTSVHFPTSDVGYIVGNQGRMLKTEDAGMSWMVLKKGSNFFGSRQHFERVYFWDAETGYVVGRKLVLHTSDGGQTWQELKSTTLDFEKFNAIFLFSPNKGIIAGESGNILLFDN